MSLEITNEKRRFHRIFYRAQASLSSGNASYNCEVVDLSLKGCLLRFDQPWQEPIEKICTFRLQLSAEISIVMQLEVSHSIDNEAGFQCVHIDIDSISQLRRLVELNLGHNELLDRDILALSNCA